MIIKLDSAIRKEFWYPRNRVFTEAEARIDLLLSDRHPDTSDPKLIQTLSTEWQWKPNAVVTFFEGLINEQFMLRDWVLEPEGPINMKAKRLLAQEVVDVFNKVFDRRVQLNDTRIRSINARIKEGKSWKPAISIKSFEAVFAHKKREWENTEQEKYLNLETLLRPSHFLQYLEAAREDYKKSQSSTTGAGVTIAGKIFQ